MGRKCRRDEGDRLVVQANRCRAGERRGIGRGVINQPALQLLTTTLEEDEGRGESCIARMFAKGALASEKGLLLRRLIRRRGTHCCNSANGF